MSPKELADIFLSAQDTEGPAFGTNHDLNIIPIIKAAQAMAKELQLLIEHIADREGGVASSDALALWNGDAK